jgi:2-hydroxy-3-oxopropionate reductase
LYARATATGTNFIDAPVSGGQLGAESGTLSIMVGCREGTLHRVQPVLEALGSRVVRIGGPGQGQVAKAANQLVVGLTIQAVAEALSLANHAGADVGCVREALLGGLAQSAILDQHGKRMLCNDFLPGARLELQAKDVRIALALASDVDAPIPASTALATIIDELILTGKGDLDHSAIILHYGAISPKR